MNKTQKWLMEHVNQRTETDNGKRKIFLHPVFKQEHELQLCNLEVQIYN